MSEEKNNKVFIRRINRKVGEKYKLIESHLCLQCEHREDCNDENFKCYFYLSLNNEIDGKINSVCLSCKRSSYCLNYCKPAIIMLNQIIEKFLNNLNELE